MSTPAVILGAATASIVGALLIVGLPHRIEAPEPPIVSEAEAPAQQVAAAGPELPAPGGLPFPVDIEVAFDLTDHFGNDVTAASYSGRPMLLFFGFASCESICTVALPRMGEALDLLGDDGDEIEALMITVDPERDTPKALRQNLQRWHKRLVGLTGDEEDLAAVRKRFQVNVQVVAEDPTGGPIYAHGSFIYLIGADGELKTMIPPILGPDKIASLAQKYF
ncbi:MAG: SCO family protein [Pseudomonadota bacterium]